MSVGKGARHEGGAAPPWRRSRERGATLVEFVIVAFIFLLVLFAGFEFSRLVLVYTTVTNAARIGARYAIVSGSKSTAPADVVSEVETFARAGTIDVLDPTWKVLVLPKVGGPPGSIVTVDVSYTYKPWTIVPLSVPLHARTQGVITY